jgi:hypothetical protein
VGRVVLPCGDADLLAVLALPAVGYGAEPAALLLRGSGRAGAFPQTAVQGGGIAVAEGMAHAVGIAEIALIASVRAERIERGIAFLFHGGLLFSLNALTSTVYYSLGLL